MQLHPKTANKILAVFKRSTQILFNSRNIVVLMVKHKQILELKEQFAEL